MASVAYVTTLTYMSTNDSGLALLAHWSLKQEINHASSVQLSHFVCTFKLVLALQPPEFGTHYPLASVVLPLQTLPSPP